VTHYVSAQPRRPHEHAAGLAMLVALQGPLRGLLHGRLAWVGANTTCRDSSRQFQWGKVGLRSPAAGAARDPKNKNGNTPWDLACKSTENPVFKDKSLLGRLAP
jgi:hypothetical protein